MVGALEWRIAPCNFSRKTLLYITDGEGVVIDVSCMLQAIGDVGTGTLEGNNQLVRNHDAPPHARGDLERSTARISDVAVLRLFF